MSDFDPTKNRTPTGLLTLDEKSALMSWPHGWESYGVEKWEDTPNPAWFQNTVYRGKPAPVVTRVYQNVYINFGAASWWRSVEAALEAERSNSIGMIYLEIVDGKIKGVGEVKGDEK